MGGGNGGGDGGGNGGRRRVDDAEGGNGGGLGSAHAGAEKIGDGNRRNNQDHGDHEEQLNQRESFVTTHEFTLCSRIRGGRNLGPKHRRTRNFQVGQNRSQLVINYANPPERECSTSLYVIQGYPRTGDSCPCTGLFAGTVVAALDEWPERRLVQAP